MKMRIIDDELSLIPYFPNPEVALAWRFGLQDADEKTIREKLMPGN